MPKRIVGDWLLWVLLCCGATAPVACILIEVQNLRSIDDRRHLNVNQQYMRGEQAHNRGELDRMRKSLDRLEAFVEQVKDEERKRREAKK